MKLRSVFFLLITLISVTPSSTSEPSEYSVCMFITFKNKTCTTRVTNHAIGDLKGGKFRYIETTGNVGSLDVGFISNVYASDGISLAKNNISVLKPGSFSNLTVGIFDLKSNNIARIDEGVFTNSSVISILDLSHNKLSYIHGNAFRNISALREVVVSFNMLLLWDREWFMGTYVDYIDFSNNLLDELPHKAFVYAQKLKSVRKLDFRHNKIAKVADDALLGLSSVNYIYLSHNKISELPATFLKGLNITYFDLSFNEIRCLPDDLSAALPVECTNLRKNDFSCKCLEEVKKWQNEHSRCLYLSLYDLCTNP